MDNGKYDVLDAGLQQTVSNRVEPVVMCKAELDELLDIAVCAEAVLDCEINKNMTCYTKEWKEKLKLALDTYSARLST